MLLLQHRAVMPSMPSTKGLSAIGLCLAVSFLAADAGAAKVPIAFAPTLGANPTRTQQKLATLEGKLPASFALPASLVTMKAGAIDLSFFPEISATLTRAGTSATSPAMTWPAPSPALCTKHAAFVVPAALLAPGASETCKAAGAAIGEKLAPATTTACRDVEQPERYVLGAPPAVVDDTTTGSIESLIGLAGEALSHYPPQTGLLPADFVPTLRSIVWKLRRPALAKQLASARASYQQAIGVLGAQPSCFDAGARTALLASLNALDGELMNAEGHLTKIETTGKATSDQELVCLAAHGRTRAALPFPALTAEERKFAAFWLGGIYWRMRGGGLIPLGQTQKARTYFCEKPFRRIGDLAGGAKGEEAGYRMFLNIFDGWGEWMDMGTTPGGQDLYEDLVQMTDRGRHQVADTPSPVSGIPIPGLGITSAVAYLDKENYDTTPLTTGGLEMGPCYAYALNALSDFRYADVPMAPYNGSLIEGFTAIGEFCTGASIALGLTESLLGGTTSGASTVPLCKNRQCGDDGCGGSCGSCAAGTTCNTDGACVTCTPSCAGKTCGGDGCGGSCGACAGADGGSPGPG
ncbi:MAG: Tryptophan synthase alpha chain, partial [Labilithrix sp.]|nr:Tryptophan synthase alpha chain [Labilithrix sp.]